MSKKSFTRVPPGAVSLRYTTSLSFTFVCGMPPRHLLRACLIPAGKNSCASTRAPSDPAPVAHGQQHHSDWLEKQSIPECRCTP